MKKITTILVFAAGLTTVSCDNVKRNPSSNYMPDMGYSRAVETYSDETDLKDAGIHYNAKPVTGTIARGEEMPFPYAKDKPGDTLNYSASKSVINPIKNMSAADMTEAERLYLIHCGICHGPGLDGNGPLYKGGDGPYPAAPRNLIDDYTKGMPDGQMFYSITYGKNLMGPYESQVSRKERWMIINYIRSKQGKSFENGSGESATASKPAADTTQSNQSK